MQNKSSSSKEPFSIRESLRPSSHVVQLGSDKTLPLDNGTVLTHVQIAYETYGKLNADKSNVVLICHALTGDQYVASTHPVTNKGGWWSNLVGPGKIVNTDIFYVICANVLGGCMGTTGPASINPVTNKPYGLDFPVITIRDMVRAQAKLLDFLGIEDLACVIGGSMGGMQALQWGISYSERVHSVLCIASGARHSAQNIAFHEVGRQAVMADPDWCKGNYLNEGKHPKRGLAVARMAAHITYLSDQALHRKFGRRLQNLDAVRFGFDADFQVESYLRHQGSSFVERFDANSYLYLTRAMDYFDIALDHDGVLANAFKNVSSRFCIVSFTSDWLFPTVESRDIVKALNAAGCDVSFADIETDKGHDAFLLDEPEFSKIVDGFLNVAAKQCEVACP